MCLLLETIRIENGQPQNLSFHAKRMNNARKHFWQCKDSIDLNKVLETQMDSAGFAIRRQVAADLQSTYEKKNKLYKCRITYAREVETTEFVPYNLPVINSLKTVFDDQIDYSFKLNDRSHIHKLYKERDGCDDILIVKQGFITDTSYANILFYNGKNWLTPAHPLLKGTQRALLLEKELILTADIRPEDLYQFKKARLINAMIRFEDALDINILNICT